MAQSLKVAVQMDHVATINPAGDSTFAMMLEAQARGHQLVHYTPDTLALRGDVVSALVQPITVTDAPKGQHFTLGEAQRIDLSSQNVLLMRQDPPFDMNYITITHLLERLHPKTLVVNRQRRCAMRPRRSWSPNFPS